MKLIFGGNLYNSGGGGNLRCLILPSKWVRSSFVRSTVYSAFAMALIPLPLSPPQKKDVNFSRRGIDLTSYQNGI